VLAALTVNAPARTRFEGRKVWDALYSAGFTWPGDVGGACNDTRPHAFGGYFHWLPSPQTDHSQGITVGGDTATGYFFPEWLGEPGGKSDVAALELVFSVARCCGPADVLNVLERSATYLARRLGGQLAMPNGSAYDSEAMKMRIELVERELVAHGVQPGSTLALQLFQKSTMEYLGVRHPR
jgi:hypothetical protein